jgi:hypothetical protein
MERTYNYEIWALSYNADQEATDISKFLGMLPTAVEAVNHAKKFYDLECIFGKGMVSEELYEGEYMEVRVEKCYEDEDEIVCEEPVYTVRLYQDGTSEDVQDFKA